MDPKTEFLFYAVAIGCLAAAAIHPQAGPGRLWVAPIRWVAAGLALALVPTMWAALVAGW